MVKHVRALLIGSVLAIGAISLRSTQNSDVRGAAIPPMPAEQLAILTTEPDGTCVWTYPRAYALGVVPVIASIAVAPLGTHALVNIQLDGAPTNTQAKFRVTTAQREGALGPISLHVVAHSPPQGE